MKTPNTSSAPRFSAQARADKVGEIHVYGAIGDSWYGITAKQVIESLDRFKREGVKQIELHVNSPGGSYYDGVAIFNALRRFDGQKTVYVDGMAASAASVVALAGDRIITGAGAMWMIHNPLNIAWGYASDLRKAADVLDALGESALQLYAGRTGQSREDLREWMDAETWMDGKLAQERGFSHETSDVPAPAESDEKMMGDSVVADLLAHFKRAPENAARLLHFAPRPQGQAPATVAPEGDEEKPMKVLMTMLGLAEKATEGEALAALEKLQNESADACAARTIVQAAEGESLESACSKLVAGYNEMRAAAGKPESSSSEACAMIAGLREKAARVDELQAQAAEFETERKQTEIAKMLDDATADGRLTPAKRAEMTGESAPSFAADPATLKVFLDCLPLPAPAPREPETKAPEMKAWAEMSNTDRASLYATNRALAEQMKAESEKK